MRGEKEEGFVLVSILFLLALFLALLGVYYTTTVTQLATVKYSKNSSSGFYGAEAGLNIRAETIRQIFVGFNRPAGASPATTNACKSGNNGSGDFVCSGYSFNNRSVSTYIEEDASNPIVLTIPPGEKYQNLNAQEYRYTAKSKAINVEQMNEAELQLRFKSRLVPLFQFAVFYNKDLEILPGPAMTLSGPVHTNGDLYLYSQTSLTINGQVTTAGSLYRGRKDGTVTPSCLSTPIRIYDPLSARTLIPTCPARYLVTNTDIIPFNNMIQVHVPQVTVPAPDVFDPTPGKVYWDKADLRLVLMLDASNNPAGIQVHNTDDSNFVAATTTLNACAGVTTGGKDVAAIQIYNFREAKNIRLMDVDLTGVLNCLQNSNWFGTAKRLDDSTEGGLVFHLTVKGPNSAALPNSYGVRIRNGAQIASTVGGAPAVRGLTVISDQAFYLMGHYNSTNKIPAAILADSMNVLSSGWSDANSALAIGSRVASSTTINSAFLAGTDVTGNTEGAGGQGGAYNGGVENYPRFHENWSGKIMTYRGSFVSLGKPRHVSGLWSAQSYNPPNRDWNYDTSFNNAANLPPITPRFVYLRQELFIRDFEQQ